MTVTYQNYLKEPDSCKPVEHFIFSLSSVFDFILFSLALYCTLMCILALFSKLSVVCLVLSGPKGTSFFSCSRYSRSLARLQTHKHRASQQTSTSGGVTQAAPTQTVWFGLRCDFAPDCETVSLARHVQSLQTPLQTTSRS